MYDKTVVTIGDTIDDAIIKALWELNCEISDISYNVIREPKKILIFKKPAIVEVTLTDDGIKRSAQRVLAETLNKVLKEKELIESMRYVTRIYPNYNRFLIEEAFRLKKSINEYAGRTSPSKEDFIKDLRIAFRKLNDFEYGKNNTVIVKNYISQMYKVLIPDDNKHDPLFNKEQMVASFADNFLYYEWLSIGEGICGSCYFSQLSTEKRKRLLGLNGILYESCDSYSAIIAQIVLSSKLCALFDKLLNNQELCQLMDNKYKLTNEDELYKIYELYYSDCFGVKLSSLEIKALTNFYCSRLHCGSIDTFFEKLKTLNINVNELADDISNCQSEQPFSNIISHYVETHKLDDVFENPKSEELISILATSLSYIVSEKQNFNQVIYQYLSIKDFCERCKIYGNKHNLLLENK